MLQYFKNSCQVNKSGLFCYSDLEELKLKKLHKNKKWQTIETNL